jgi:pimeloyl-ACP methyl ester carboxylesterase
MALWSNRSGLLLGGGAVALVALVVGLLLVMLLPSGEGGQAVARHRPESARSTAASDPPSRGPEPAPSVTSGSDPPYAVQTSSVRFFDPSRTTPARGTVPAAQGRVLVTDLFVPIGASGPRPLVVFAHGWNSDPGVYASLLEGWAAAGFVVAAPVFPESTDLYPGSPVSDYADQALDISFVITSLLDDQAAPIDPTRIAVTGHSDGGTDVALMALDPAYADPRVRAYICMSGEMPSGIAPYAVATTQAALLVAVGSDDEYGLYPLSTQVFQAALAPAKAMLVEPGGDHLGSFLGATPVAAAMRDAETQFLELALEPQTPSAAAIDDALAEPATGSLQVVPAS